MKKLLTTLMTLAAVITLQAQTPIKLNPEKNKIYRFKAVSEQNVSQTVNGVEQTTNSASTTLFSLKMLDATPDFMVMEVRFDSIMSKTNAMGQVVNINSTKEGNMASQEASDVMTAVMNRLCRNPLFIKMDITGKVIEIVNYDMLSQMVLKDTTLITGMAAPVLKTQVINTVSLDALKPMIETFTFNLPGKEVKNGDSWELISPVSSGGMQLEVKSNYQLKSINGANAEINSESSIKPSLNAKPMNYGGAHITYDNLSGIGKSQLTIDTQTGLMRQSNSKMHITGDLNVSVQGMNMQIPMVIDSESVVTGL
jgi:hypothetical protein